jgi:hypothetical protein
MIAHDFVLRRNIRIGSSRKKPTPFVASTYGSHHVLLVTHVAELWNKLIRQAKNGKDLIPLSELQDVKSNEAFGLGPSRNVESFGGLLDTKSEEDLAWDFPVRDDLDIDRCLQHLGVDPTLRFLPQVNDDTATGMSGGGGDDLVGKKALGGDHVEGMVVVVVDKAVTSGLVSTTTAEVVPVSISYRSRSLINVDQRSLTCSINLIQDHGIHDIANSVGKRKLDRCQPVQNSVEEREVPVTKRPRLQEKQVSAPLLHRKITS